MRVTGWTALPLILALASPALAQEASSVAEPVSASSVVPDPNDVGFSADVVTYDSDNEIITAAGRVRLSREGNYVAADQVVWDRRSGQVVATGNVVVTNPAGDKFVGERAVLTDDIRDATVEDLLVVLESGGRLAAQRATRVGDITTLENAVYSACPVRTEAGCPKRPGWRVTAARVIYDSARDRVRFQRGRLEILGIALPLIPIFSVATGRGSEGVTGVLFPEIKLSGRNGFELALPFHLALAPNRDLTLTPHVYTESLPALELKFRELNRLGAFQIGGFATYGDRNDDDAGSDDGLRAYVEANGKAQLDPLWSLTGQFRRATDKTVARRYDITREDKLRSFLNLERIDFDSYASIAAWSFQGLRETDRQKQIPIALPAIDARWRLVPPAIGGRVELQANSLAILRRDGQDTQRAFAGARWDRRFLTGLGQELLLTGYARGDLYHTDETEKTSALIYRGEEGWNARGIVAAAAEARWPLIGPFAAGLQRVTPRVQLVLTPPVKNFRLPNEDSRAVDLEDSNLFALNRFPGYDRWEDGSRITYGLDWGYDRPNLAISTTIGQSYRLNRGERIFPDGTGLAGRWSDFVGRSRVQFGRFLDLTHRYRLDKDGFAVRRNELDLTVGTVETYARIGYLRLNRNIDSAVEDLRDKEELRVAGRWQFRRYWSIFGSTVLDLTDEQEDPLSLADGFEPVRHRLSLDYEDDCLAVGMSWRRDYERFGSLREGSTFQLRLALKGLGR
ncbi:MAG TPA: LPS assembly protein LptD [Sphingomicrobium sp.]|nr:LPS assembly protein LptD [Sphingomicrobium sp.]